MPKYNLKQTVKVGGRIVKPDPQGVELSEKEAKAAAHFILGQASADAQAPASSGNGKGTGGKSAGSSSAAGKGDDPASKDAGESSKNTQRSGEDPSGKAPAGGEPDKTDTGPSDAKGDGAKPKAEGPEKVNVNTASASAIAKAVPGIGPATAKDLIKHRKAKPFESLDDLTRVGGISKTIIDENRDVLTV